MADGVAITAGSGTTIASDDCGASGHAQILKIAYSADGVATLVPVDANGVLVNTELPAAAALSDTIANPTSPMLGAGGMLWEPGTTVWKRTRQAMTGAAGAIAPTGVPATALYGYYGSDQLAPLAVGAAAGDSNAGAFSLATCPSFYNGASFDRIRGDITNGLDVDVTRMPKVAAATLANVASSATNVTLQASNAARVGLIIFNDSTASVFVKYGATASATSFTYKLNPGAQWEMPQPIYTGIVDGIWTAANGNARMTEL